MKKEKTSSAKPKYNTWQDIVYMIRYACKIEEKEILFVLVINALAGAGIAITNLFFIPALVQSLEKGSSLQGFILMVLAFVGTLMVLNAISSYLSIPKMFPRITCRSFILADIVEKSITSSYPNLFKEKFLNLHSKAKNATNNNDDAPEYIWTVLEELLKNMLCFVVYTLLIGSLSPILAIIVLATSIVGYLVTRRLNEYGYRHKEEVGEIVKKMNYVSGISEDREAAKDIRIFGMKDWLTELYYKSRLAHKAFHNKAENMYLIGRIVDVALLFLRNGIVYYYLIYMILHNNMSTSVFLLMFSAIGGFAGWVTGILDNMSKLQKQSLDICAIREFLEYEEEFKFEDGEDVPEASSYEIELRNVSFKYPETEKYVLKNINLTLHAGEKLAVVGMNGAGKTTLIKLMCGFLDPTEGEVLFNGVDIRRYNRRDYYKLFSAVFQDFRILAGSVAMNVSQKVLNNFERKEDTDNKAPKYSDAEKEKIEKCLEAAGLKEKFDSLPDGIDTFLERKVYENAIMLSGGETQRLMLARALYKDAPFVILDEPTAALDPLAEEDLYNKYNDLTRNKSSVYISHRLASTRFCDRIILIADGRIAEEGTHESLMEAGQEYASLFEVQSKYYKEGDYYESEIA